MNNNDLQEYSDGIINSLIYSFHPMYRLPEKGTLEKYEKGKWIPASESTDSIKEELGEGMYEFYEKWMINKKYQNKIIGFIEMKEWARWTRKSIFALTGLFITTLGIIGILPFPISPIIGLIVTGTSLWLNYKKIKEPFFV